MLQRKYVKSLKIIVVSLILTSIIIFDSHLVSSQSNIIEEENLYKIFASNLYDIAVQKSKGPDLEFQFTEMANINFELNYVSEYVSSTIFLNSLSSLTGKGYYFNLLDWDSIGESYSEKTSVNHTKLFLDHNTSIISSVTVFNYDLNLNNYEIKAIQNTYIEMTVRNWTFTPGSRGLALNVLAYEDDSEDYVRLGPYFNFTKDRYEMKIKKAEIEFLTIIHPKVKIITDTQKELNYETNAFANYNVGIEENAPADFWISVPYSGDFSEITFTFLCSYTLISTNNSSLKSVWIVISSLFITNMLARSIIIGRRKY
ncbi:MAG: hypothetical protein FK734_14505 [Asgard group archaeon]|nr:hypothetical protein [Asgard group archaeon]